jgi:hypothetical protein
MPPPGFMGEAMMPPPGPPPGWMPPPDMLMRMQGMKDASSQGMMDAPPPNMPLGAMMTPDMMQRMQGGMGAPPPGMPPNLAPPGFQGADMPPPGRNDIIQRMQGAMPQGQVPLPRSDIRRPSVSQAEREERMKGVEGDYKWRDLNDEMDRLRRDPNVPLLPREILRNQQRSESNPARDAYAMVDRLNGKGPGGGAFPQNDRIDRPPPEGRDRNIIDPRTLRPSREEQANHEQSETVQNEKGEWVNVYGRNLPKAGQQLPGTPTYPTMEEAVGAAKQRSQEHGRRGRRSEGDLTEFSSQNKPLSFEERFGPATGLPPAQVPKPSGTTATSAPTKNQEKVPPLPDTAPRPPAEPPTEKVRTTRTTPATDEPAEPVSGTQTRAPALRNVPQTDGRGGGLRRPPPEELTVKTTAQRQAELEDPGMVARLFGPGGLRRLSASLAGGMAQADPRFGLGALQRGMAGGIAGGMASDKEDRAAKIAEEETSWKRSGEVQDREERFRSGESSRDVQSATANMYRTPEYINRGNRAWQQPTNIRFNAAQRAIEAKEKTIQQRLNSAAGHELPKLREEAKKELEEFKTVTYRANGVTPDGRDAETSQPSGPSLYRPYTGPMRGKGTRAEPHEPRSIEEVEAITPGEYFKNPSNGQILPKAKPIPKIM